MCKNMLTFLYLPFSHRHSLVPSTPHLSDAISSQSTACWADQRIIFFPNPQRANYNSSQLYVFSEGGKKKSAKYEAVDSGWQLQLLRNMILLHMSVWSPLLKQASFHSPEAESKEAVKSQRQNSSTPVNLTCSDRPHSSLPTLITQINIKLNTRPRSVNFYVVKNDWLFASLHQRDQRNLGWISQC